MCTVSWIHSGGAYEVFCNRDERITRKPATGPRPGERDGVRYLSPVDGDFGGSWIAVNEFGVTLALLNVPMGAAPRGSRSRGLLVLDLIPEPSLDSLRPRLARSGLDAYSPFALAAFQTGEPVLLFEWDGSGLTVTPNAEPRLPLTSSSFDPQGVRERRHRDFEQRVQEAGGVDPAVLLAFHHSHAAGPDAYSTCMHRADANTVSLSRVSVSDSDVSFYYSPAAPCRRVPGETAALALAGRAMPAAHP